ISSTIPPSPAGLNPRGFFCLFLVVRSLHVGFNPGISYTSGAVPSPLRRPCGRKPRPEGFGGDLCPPSRRGPDDGAGAGDPLSRPPRRVRSDGGDILVGGSAGPRQLKSRKRLLSRPERRPAEGGNRGQES